MFNPILGEIVAREQRNDQLRYAEQRQQAKAAATRQPVHRIERRTSFGKLLLAVLSLFRG